jgi:dihydroorotate dehydrogenase (fumarate)
MFIIYVDISKNTTEQIHSTGKPYIVSLSGLCLEHNIQMLEKIAEAPEGIAAIELNVACPNVPNKPMIAYDFDQLETVLNRITSMAQFSRLPPIGLKLAPYFDMPHFERVAMLISKYPIKFIVCVNTIGNGLVVDWENECEGMAAKSGLGGIGGGFIKHTALANVRMFYKLLNDKYARPDIDIIGVGGVHSGRDAFELILCGAKAIQVGTCHWTEGSSCFERISKELEEIMKSKGYKSIDDFRGKLKPYIRSSNNNKSTKASTVGADTKTETTANESLINPLNAILILIIAVLLAKEFFMK